MEQENSCLDAVVRSIICWSVLASEDEEFSEYATSVTRSSTALW